MTNIPDEKMLEFCKAREGWFWNDNPAGAVKARTIHRGEFRAFHKGTEFVFKNFSLEKPQAYVDRAWYTATNFPQGVDICCYYNSQLNLFICDGYRYNANQLTNIRRIPKELWEGDG